MLETSNVARRYTPICSFRKYTFQYLDLPNSADVSIFLKKNSFFFPKKYLYSKQQCERCVRDFSVLFSVFLREKATVTENITFAESVSGIWSLECSKLAKNPERDNDVTISRHDLNVKFFDVVLFLLSSLVTGPRFMSISSQVLEL